jgi:hypothetical protein
LCSKRVHPTESQGGEPPFPGKRAGQRPALSPRALDAKSGDPSIPAPLRYTGAGKLRTSFAIHYAILVS